MDILSNAVICMALPVVVCLLLCAAEGIYNLLYRCIPEFRHTVDRWLDSFEEENT